jgi:DNA-binding CsgD family transcriptional regulator/tetratricopeptide (TPR) repeat protein
VTITVSELSVPDAMMGTVAPDRSATHPLMGRARELATLSDWVGVNGSSPTRAVLLAGDAGVGKTRLLAELTASAERAGWRTMVGHCLDFGDSALPYLPFSELVGRLAAEDATAVERLAETHPAISVLAPGRRMLSGAGKVQADDLDRGELFEAVHGVIEELAVASPVLVVIEDVHWADQSTRDLLSFLFARPFRGEVAVVASYRTDDLHRRHPLRATAAEWARVPGVQRLLLGPLPDADVRRLVRSLHTGPLRERDVARIVDRAEGNAFFAEELLGASEMSTSGLPDDLADLLLVRLDRLDDGGRAIVRAASCAGRRVSHALLASVVALSELEMERALRSAVDSNVLVHLAPDGYAFRHALLAEAVYDDLLPGERVRLHASYVQVLASKAVDGTAAELAMHARAAHDIATAVRASITAGEDAMAVGGPDEAAKHFETALELIGRTAHEEIDVVGLVSKANDAVVASGHPARAMALVTDHLNQLPADAPDADRARLLIALASTSLLIETRGASLQASTEALGLIDEQPTSLRARAMSVHARTNADEGNEEEAARYAMEALSLAQRLDLPRLVAEATTTLAGVDNRAGQVDVALKSLQQVVDLARRDRDTAAEMRGQFLIGQLHFERANLSDAQDAYHLATVAASAAGRPWAPYGFDARLMESMVAYVRGDWDEALRIVDISGQVPPSDPEALLLSVEMMVAAGRGYVDALKLYDEIRPSWVREGQSAINSGTAAIDLLGDSGSIPEMMLTFDEMVECLSITWNPHFQARIRTTALVLGQLATSAITASQAERSALMDRVPELISSVEAVRQRVKTRKRPFGPEGLAWVARVHSEHLRLRWLADQDGPDEAELVAAWIATVEAFEELGHVFEIARSQARLAAVLRAVGRTAEADELVAKARATADALGAGPLQAELDAVSTRPRPQVRRVASESLTGREAEILGLVAQGKSNGEIGRQLFISAKTVSVHVSNILAKLGAGGRTEAAAIARRDGLLP